MMRRSLFCGILLVALGLGCGGWLRADGSGPQGVRAPAVAGQFYPGDGKTLTAALDGFLRDAIAPSGERPIALIAPHAGYAFSGQIAADAWRQTSGHSYDIIVLLGTNHTTAGSRSIGVFTGSGLRTPLGVVAVDQPLSARLIEEDADCVADAGVHAREHSIEVHLPFVQRLFPDARVVAAIVSSEDAAVLTRFGRALAKVLSGRQALIVASSDLSHYPSAKDAVVADARTLGAFASLDVERVRAAMAFATPGAGSLSTCACGDAPVMAAMIAAKALGAVRGRVVSYANSGDVAVGESDRVVGYGAVVFSAGRPGADTTAVAARGAVPPDAPLPESDKKQLLSLARETIRRYLESGMLPLARGLSAAADRQQGAFVTLRKKGELRGCIGQMQPDAPLRRLVGTMALAAAFEDRRFDKVRAAELKDIEVEISVLTPFKPVPGPESVVVGRDGVLLRKDGSSAVFLPQVATEEHWTRDVMLDNLCTKGGLQQGCWRTGAKLFTFQADVFGEREFK
ncbi:MAG TPA: AmmeMemoRadiSam system protein B [Vicinamibacterales bacterium]|jgi:hypothetical protein